MTQPNTSAPTGPQHKPIRTLKKGTDGLIEM